MTTSPSLTEQLANIHVSYVMWFVVAVTILRLAFVRSQSPGSRGAAEFMESAIIAVVLVFMILRPFVVQAYFIPSPSMVPTLLGKGGTGDRILVNKFIYRVAKPQHDDVVVFIPPPLATEGTPEETGGVPVNFIKRMIAVPGDTLEVHAGSVKVNGMPFDHTTVLKDLIDAHVIQTHDTDDPDDPRADHRVKFTAKGVLADGKLVPNSALAQALTDQPSEQVEVVPGQTILNGKVLDEPFIAEDPDYDLKIYKGESLKHDNSINPWRLDGQTITKSEYDADMAAPEEKIPPHEYFMMGDNRNDSKDSTEWGPLEENRIVGKAQFIFWPLNRIRAIH